MRYGKTVGLFLCMLKSYILHQGREVCYPLFRFLRSKGSYCTQEEWYISACAFIEKHQFRPSGVLGSFIDNHMTGTKVGDVCAVQGTLESISYKLWELKEPDHIMKMTATGGSLIADDT